MALQTADTAGSNTINLTQQFLAEMLGVRRTSVTEVARKIQNTGAIHYARGEISILDRQISRTFILRMLHDAGGAIEEFKQIAATFEAAREARCLRRATASTEST